MIANNIEKMRSLVDQHLQMLEMQGEEAQIKLDSGAEQINSKSIFDPWRSQFIDAIYDFLLIEESEVKPDLIFGEPQEAVDFNNW